MEEKQYTSAEETVVIWCDYVTRLSSAVIFPSVLRGILMRCVLHRRTLYHFACAGVSGLSSEKRIVMLVFMHFH